MAKHPAQVARAPLSRERIATAALKLIDENGLEELSTRRLGAALGCEAMAIYNHFASKDAVLDAVVDSLFPEIIIPASGHGWEARVLGFASSYRALAHKHPKAFPLLATRRVRARARDVIERIRAALLEEGFAPKAAAEIFRVVANYCNGSILDELSGAFPAACPEDHPSIAKVQEHLAPEHYDAMFDKGLRLLLAGFSP